MGLLSACGGGTTYAPISERRPGETGAKIRMVRSGDTLYSIAWERDLDYRDLAKWNRIPSPYLIRPGDRLYLYPNPALRKQAGIHKPAVRPKPRGSGAKSRQKVERWSWPAAGKVIRHFSVRRGSKGIDIAGRAGQAVKATAAGKVVYRGSGLRGYGQLIIIKHNETFLSAYAHNEKILVKEGAWVRRGQKIATMGNTGTDRTKLHFELRRHGVPTNPLRYLPKHRR